MRQYGIELAEGSALSNATVASGATFPQTPSLGELFYKTGSGASLYVYNGTTWVDTLAGSSGSSTEPYDITGDVTGTIEEGAGVLTLANVLGSPVTDSLRKITVNAKGLVVATSTVTSGDITTVLGYSPISGAAGSTGNIQLKDSGGGFAATGLFSFSSGSTTLTIGDAVTPATLEAAGGLDVVINGSTAVEFTADGPWLLNSQTGTEGQVLSSRGVGESPVWSSINSLLDYVPVSSSQTIAIQGDISVTPTPYGTGNISPIATLATVNTSPVTDLFQRVTVNGKGLVTSTANVSPSNITTALGYTPANLAGATFTGTVELAGDPTQALHAATKQYVDASIQGLSVKDSVRVASVNEISSLANLQTIDGVALSAYDRILVKNQTDLTANGIYVVVDGGPWVRAVDADNPSELQGAFTFVEQGTINAGSGWFQSLPVANVGTDDMDWTQFSGAGTYTAGTGLTLTGGQFSLTNIGTPLTAFFGRVTTNVKGQVVASEAATSTDITTALGYTPVSPAGSEGQIQFKSSSSTLAASADLSFETVDGKGVLAVNDKITSLDTSTKLELVGGNSVPVTVSGGWGAEASTTNGGDLLIMGGNTGGGDTGPGSIGGDPPVFTPPTALKGGKVVIRSGTTPGLVNIGSDVSPVLVQYSNWTSGDIIIETPHGDTDAYGVTGDIKLRTDDTDRLTITGEGNFTIDVEALTIGCATLSINGQAGTAGQVLASGGPSAGPTWIDVGAGTVTSVAVSGGTTGLTTSGGPVTTSGTITLAGTLAIANGGSGQTTAQGALNAFLPAQTGNTGKNLVTDGTNAYWGNVVGTVTSVSGSGGSTGLTLGGGPITGAGTLTLGGTLSIGSGGTGQTTALAAINALLPSQTGNSGKYLTSDGTDPSWGPLIPEPAGTDGQIQFNDNGTQAGLQYLTWSETTGVLRLGRPSSDTVYLTSPLAFKLNVAGDLGIQLVTDDTVRFTITDAGALGIGATPSYGTSGQVLTSGGAGVAPSWTTAGTGTVTTVSIADDNGVSGTVATASTTPEITIVLGDITPSSINTAGTITATGNITTSGTITATNFSGTNTGDQTITLTGDVTGSGTSGITTALATVNSNVGSFGSNSQIPVITVDAKGRITAATTATATLTPAGLDKSVQYNNGGVLAGASGITVTGGAALDVTGKVTAGDFETDGKVTLIGDGVVTSKEGLTLKVEGGDFDFSGGTSGDGGDIELNAGTASGATFSAGDVTISGGNSGSNANGGSVILRASSGNGTGTNGIFQVRTSPTGTGVGTVNRFTITGDGKWYVDSANTQGGNGDVLMTNGSGVPAWTSIASTYLSLGGGTLTGPLTLSGDPTLALHAVPKQYVDALVAGLTWKQAVRAATTANITLSGTQTVDGVALIAGDRVLVKNQTAPAENGLYVVAAGAWARTSDMDSAAEANAAAVFVTDGSANADTGWVQTATIVTLGTTSQSWSQFTAVTTTSVNATGTITAPPATISTTKIGVDASAQPRIYLASGSASTTNRLSSIYVDTSGVLNFSLLNDAASTEASWMTVTRSANVATSIGLSGRVDVKTITEATNATTATSTTTIDCSLGTIIPLALDANITTLSFTNVPPSGKAFSLSLFITQGAGGSKTISWPGAVKWAGGNAPTLTTTASKVDVITLITLDGGTSWYGFSAGLNF